MRVLLVTGEYPPQIGGVGDHSQGLARALRAAGLEAAVLTTAQVSNAERPAQQGGAENPDGVRVLRTVPAWDWRALRRVRQAVDALRPDVVHLQYQAAAYGMHLAANLLPAWLRWRRPTAPVVTTFHDLREPYLFPKAGPLRRWAIERTALGSRGVIATNPEDRDRLERILTGRPGALGLIPLAVDSLQPEEQADRTRTRKAWGVPDGPLLIGYFGLLNASKGVDTLLEALQLLRAGGTGAELMMVGEAEGASDPTNREYARRIRDLARRLGVAEQVRWTGPLPAARVPGALGALDCCVLPYADGASYRRSSLLAALAAGVPVVTTQPRHTGIAPLFGGGCLPPLRDGVHCRLAPAGDAVALAGVIREVRDNPGLRERLAAGGRALASRLSWSEVCRRTVELYRRVLEAEGSRRE